MTYDLSQCKDCIFLYRDIDGRKMCHQVGSDFYLEWKLENCPKYVKITNNIQEKLKESLTFQVNKYENSR